MRQAAERVVAVAQVHQRLYTSDDVQFAEMRTYFRKLLEDRQMAAKDRGCQLSVEVEDVKLSTDRAISVGIIVTALVTNSLKYAYPGSGGPLRVRLVPIQGDLLCLAVEDDGVGHPTTINGDGVKAVGNGAAGNGAQGTGVGSRIVVAIAKSLGAELDQDSDGTGFRSVLTFPRTTERMVGASQHLG